MYSYVPLCLDLSNKISMICIHFRGYNLEMFKNKKVYKYDMRAPYSIRPYTWSLKVQVAKMWAQF